MTFEYLQRVVIDGELDVPDIGQCCILGRNDLGEEHYLVVKTIMGFTEIVTFGPCVPDLDILPFNVNLNYSRFEYSQSKIERIIDKFLNDPKKLITQAEVVGYIDILPNIRVAIDKIVTTNEVEIDNECD